MLLQVVLKIKKKNKLQATSNKQQAEKQQATSSCWGYLTI